ncbi:hypothetical protein VW29_08910 [Devosia limi DSM 17137]|uniref:Anti-sigma-K factor RskA n=1 Tax=Devosia limi DSM 17137 TaxID=1121477 RepID=A0A0F5LRF9_9HYPH|nr:anti-sigma factor [Devosia limi]KKB84928.1 hypothetical protein VW29_08910 [Devosia limi DSM 17137]SHF05128.1 Anti-sigma-K factor RskA [Devosia limi DSM 17137]
MTSEQMELAGQYVLGLLDGSELAAFERAMADDAELAKAVDRLQAHLQALDDTATPQAVSPGLWAGIEQRLDAPPAYVNIRQQRKPGLSRVGRGNWMAMAASVVVALGVGYLAGSFGTGQRQPVMIAVLLNQSDAMPGAIVEAFADDSVRLLPLEQFSVPEGQVLQVWTLPDPATGPVSLGTFTDPRAIRLAGPDLPAPQSGQLYEITLEPAPGSPTGKPTGPILVKGFAKAPLS